MQCSMKYLAIQLLVQLSQGIDLNFSIAHISLDDHTTRPTLTNTIDLQLFLNFLKNLTKTVGNF